MEPMAPPAPATFSATINVEIVSPDRTTALRLALQAAKQLELRLGDGPHSVAPYLPESEGAGAHVKNALVAGVAKKARS